MNKVLILEKENPVSNRLVTIIKGSFSTTFTEKLEGAIELIAANDFDALFVGISDNQVHGIEFIKILNSHKGKDYKVFALDAGTNTVPRIQALSFGARDVLHEDMHQDEVLLRVKNQINILGRREVFHNDLKISIPSLTAFHNKIKLDLTLIEFKILLYLMKNAETVVSRESLKLFTWADHVVHDKTINTHLTNLRIKIANSTSKIKSVKGEGIILT